LTRPGSDLVIALPLAIRKPVAIHAYHAPLLAARIVEGEVTHRRTRTLAHCGDHMLEVQQRLHRLAVDALDHGSARHRNRAEHVTGIGNVDASDRHVEVARLLIGKLVNYSL